MEIDYDLLYYLYCVGLGLSERNFFESPLKIVICLISIHKELAESQERQDDQEIQDIHSMKEIEGWLNE